MTKLLVIISIIIFVFSPILSAAKEELPFDKGPYIKSAETKKVLKLSLTECIIYTFENNSEIKVKYIEPDLREDDVKIAYSEFEPTLDFDGTLYDSIIQPTSAIGASEFRTVDLDFSLFGKLITGTEYELDFLNTYYKSNSIYQAMNPYYMSGPEISISQPIARGAGILINEADIIISRNNKLSSWQGFRNTSMDILTKTKIAYYDYTYAQETYSIAGLSLDRAIELSKINKLRYGQGLVSSVDLLEAESAASEREKVLLNAELFLRKSEDRLKLITNLVDDPEVWNDELKLTDRPGFEIRDIDPIESLENAFKYRPDYIQKKIDLENRNIKIMVAKNALLPTIDLIGSFGLNGLGLNYQKCIENVSTNHRDWSAGVKFDLPWGGGDRARYDQRKLEKAQALIEFNRLEQNIIFDVRDKIRDVDIQRRQVEASKISKEKETENYKAQQERYAAGQVSTHDLLDYQDKLARAEFDYVTAIINYNIALIKLDMAEGLTMVRNNIILEEQ